MGCCNILFAAGHRGAHLGAAMALLLACALLVAPECYARGIEAAALRQRLPVTIKITIPEAQARIRRWQTFIRRNRHAPETVKLTLVNAFFNKLRFVSDESLWRQSDYWATPLQLLAAGGGDCEDFAIAKYFTLRAMGVADDHLRITYVWNHDTPSGRPEPHMVLTVASPLDGAPLVAQRKELEPVYALNSHQLWLVGDGAKTLAAGSPAQIPQWRRFSQAMARDTRLLLQKDSH